MANRHTRSKHDPRYETLNLDESLTAEQKNKVRPCWREDCENCGLSPIVPMTGLCGLCTFGDADTIAGEWWDFEKDQPKRK